MVTAQIYSGFVTADQAITSSTTLATITGLSAAMEANRAYGFDSCVQFNLAGVISGFKFGISTPASPTNASYGIEVISNTSVIAGVGLSAQLAAALATTGLHIVRFRGLVENGANAGNLALQFAQNVSDGSAITIKRGSWFTIWSLT